MKSKVSEYIYVAIAAVLMSAAISACIDVPSSARFVYNTDKMLFHIGLLGLAAVIGSFFVRPRIRLVAIDAAVAAAVVITLVSACVNGGIASGYSLSEALPYLLLYVIFRSFFSSCPRRGEIAAETILFLFTVFEAFTGLRQIYGFASSNHGLFSITGTFFNPGPYAGFLAMGMAAAFGFVLRYGRSVVSIVSARRYTTGAVIFRLVPFASACAALLLSVIVMPATESRAAWLAAVAGVSVALLSDTRCRKMLRRVRVLSWKSVAAVTVVAVALWGAYLMKERSADGRLLIWKIEARAMAVHPLLGVGPGNFAGAFGREQARYLSSGNASDVERSVAGSPEYGFNEYLRIGTETGVPGLVAAVALTLLTVWALFRQRKPSSCAVAALAVFAFFSYPLYFAPVNFLLVMFIASAASGGYRCKRSVRAGFAVAVASTVAATVAVPLLSPVFGKRAEAYARWGKASMWSNAGRYEYLAEEGERLYVDMRHNYRFLFSYGYALFKQQDYATSYGVLEEGSSISCDPMFRIIMGRNCELSGDAGKAERHYTEACDMVPGRLYPRSLLMKLYDTTGRTEDAREAARMLLATETSVMTPAMTEIRKEAEAFLEKSASVHKDSITNQRYDL